MAPRPEKNSMHFKVIFEPLVGMRLLLILAGYVQAIVYLATGEGLTPVIPFFTYQGNTYPIESPTGLGGRAVAALNNYSPGYMHAWMPEEATEQELARFDYKLAYRKEVFERWRVHASRLSRTRRKTIPIALRSFDLWQHLESQPSSEKISKKMHSCIRWLPQSSLSEKHLLDFNLPLLKRIENLAAEANYQAEEMRKYASFFHDLNMWTIRNHSIVGLLPIESPDSCQIIMLELLLKIGWRAVCNMQWTPAQLNALAGVQAIHRHLYGPRHNVVNQIDSISHELMLLQNLKHDKEDLCPSSIEWYFDHLDQTGPCHLLAALHLSDLSLERALLEHSPTRAMEPETRKYLQNLDFPADILVRFGFYRVKEVDPAVILPILQKQPISLIGADLAGFMALCARLTPLIPKDHDLGGAPWPVLLGLRSMNQRNIDVIIALMKLPQERVFDPFSQEFKRFSVPRDIDLDQMLPHVEDGLRANTKHAQEIILELINLDHKKVIQYLCLEPNLEESIQPLMNQVLRLFKGQESWGNLKVNYLELCEWRNCCLPAFKDHFEFWLKDRNSDHLFSRHWLYMLL